MYAFVLGVLACWRLTHLLNAEDGPGEIFVRFRRLAGEGFFGALLDCFYCLSLWISAPVAIAIGRDVREIILLWLSISAGAILLERVTAGAMPHYEEKEIDDELLRKDATGSEPAPG